MKIFKSLALLLFLCISAANSSAMNLEFDAQVGAQTSWPATSQYGIGTSLNFASLPWVFFPYLSVDLYGVEYLNKTVYFKEFNYGLGAKYIQNGLIFRGMLGRMYRVYEGLNDESYRAAVGFGTYIGQIETTLNYYHYYPLDKQAVAICFGIIF